MSACIYRKRALIIFLHDHFKGFILKNVCCSGLYMNVCSSGSTIEQHVSTVLTLKYKRHVEQLPLKNDDVLPGQYRKLSPNVGAFLGAATMKSLKLLFDQLCMHLISGPGF
jgi:hypothetical protein